MKKFLLSASLVSGTSLGVGMIALPMTLCKIGILPTIGLILGVWFLMYLSSLFGIELNLRAGRGLPLGKLASLYSGPFASGVGTASLMLLIYALLCAYLYGGASILQAFLASYVGVSLSLKGIVLVYALLLALGLMAHVEWVLQINRFLLSGLLVIFGILVLGLFYKIEPFSLPLTENLAFNITSWTGAIPLLSTSFGFQVISHTLTNFCGRDPLLLKRALFWGSLVPAVVYILWTVSTLGVLYGYAPVDYQSLLEGNLEVGQFIQTLAKTASWSLVQILASVISLVAIVKSSIAIALALLEVWKERVGRYSRSTLSLKGLPVMLTLLPPLGVALGVPHLFLQALRFGGMVSIVIAVLLPLWLIIQPKAQAQKPFYALTQSRGVRLLCLSFGILVILCEVVTLFMK